MNLIVIPTYDERESIVGLLDELLALDGSAGTHVLVVDDSGPDGTADRVRAHPACGTRVFVLSRAVKDGLGAAYRAGFAWALERGYETIVQMDADGSHPAEAVPRLLHALEEGAGVAIGSRYVRGGRTEGWSWHRRLISAGGNTYVRIVLGTPVRDATAGFRAFRAGQSKMGPGIVVEALWRVLTWRVEEVVDEVGALRARHATPAAQHHRHAA